MSQRDRGQGIRDKRQEVEEGEGKKQERVGVGDICPRATKDCFWIERRQMWPIGK